MVKNTIQTTYLTFIVKKRFTFPIFKKIICSVNIYLLILQNSQDNVLGKTPPPGSCAKKQALNLILKV